MFLFERSLINYWDLLYSNFQVHEVQIFNILFFLLIKISQNFMVYFWVFIVKKNLAIAPAYSLIFVTQNTPDFIKM